jgi:hypothetical protein
VSKEIEESLQFFEELGFKIEDAQALDDLKLIRSVPSIVFIGMINRGKSSLINQIIGQDLLPTGVNPETFACTILETSDTGSFLSHLMASDGSVETISNKADFFTQVERKKSNLKFREARVQSDFRLPIGFALIDTPGCNDISVNYDEELSNLEQTWQNHGAMAGVLVSSIPPGVSGQDVKLLHSLKGKFGDRVAVVLKQTQSSLTVEDLENAAEVWSQHGVNAIIVSDDLQSGSAKWGFGRLSKLEEMLSSMWSEGEVAKDEASDRLERFFEREGRNILALPNIFNPDSVLTKSLIYGALDRQNLLSSFKKAANEKYVIDYENSMYASSVIKNVDQFFAAVEAAIRGSSRASQSISMLISKETGVASFGHEGLIALMINKKSRELDSIIMGYTPSSKQFELVQLRKGINAILGHNRERAVDLLRGGFTRLLEKCSNEVEVSRVADNFGDLYPEVILTNLMRIWRDLSIPVDPVSFSEPNLSSSISSMKRLVDSDFLDELGRNVFSDLSEIRSKIYQLSSVGTVSSVNSEDWFGSKHALGSGFQSGLVLSFSRWVFDKYSNNENQKLEKVWANQFSKSKLLELEQWNKCLVRFSRGAALFNGSLGTRTQQLAESIFHNHTSGGFGRWILTVRDVNDAISSKSIDQSLATAHKTASWVFAVLGAMSLLAGNSLAAGLLICAFVSFLCQLLIRENGILKVKPFREGRRLRSASDQLLVYLIVIIISFFLMMIALTAFKNHQEPGSQGADSGGQWVANSGQMGNLPIQSSSSSMQQITESVAVPSVSGLTVEDAIEVLTSQSFRLNVVVVEVSSDLVEQGLVIGTDQPVGALVGAGSPIVIQVSSGAQVVVTTVPVLTTVPRVVTTVPATTSTSTTLNRNAVLTVDSDFFSSSSIQLKGTDPFANLVWWTIRIRDPFGGRLGTLGTIGARLCPVTSSWPDGAGCTGAVSAGIGNNVDMTFKFLFAISPQNGGIGGQWVPRIFGPISGLPDVVGSARLTVIPRP